jgi:RNA polymerase sigma-70 factor, ECF subfamily
MSVNNGSNRELNGSLDQELIRRVKGGNKQAYGLLVERYQGRILAVLTQYLHNASDAEDVAQETFVRAYRSLSSFRGDSAFYTWLHRIAINTAKNAITARNCRPPTQDVDLGDSLNDGIDTRLRDHETPEAIRQRHEVEGRLQRAIDGLEHNLQTALILREYEGMSYQDIAITTEVPVGTVRSRIFRARQLIEEALRPFLEMEL